MSLDNLMYGLRLTVIAMGVVFTTLYLLSLAMYALPLLAGQRRQPKPRPTASVETTPVEQHEPPLAAAEENAGAPKEVIAVIATALAAYLGQTPENLNIISIRRTSLPGSPWMLAARRESTQN